MGKIMVVINNVVWSSMKLSVVMVINGKVVVVGKGKMSIIVKWNNKKVMILVMVK